jgi:hypothetical protein
VLKISHPCEITSIPSNLYELEQHEKPFSRNAFELVNYSALKISNAIEADDISNLFHEEKNKSEPMISYNFCESLVKLFDEEREIPFQLIFYWSKSSLQKIPHPTISNQISFPYSIKSKMEEVKAYFEPPKKDSLKKEFYGTVDTLGGIVGEDNRRSGAVTITIFDNHEVFKSKVNLSPDQYQIALAAHEKGNALVKIIGDLKRGKRSQYIENVQSFNLVE